MKISFLPSDIILDLTSYEKHSRTSKSRFRCPPGSTHDLHALSQPWISQYSHFHKGRGYSPFTTGSLNSLSAQKILTEKNVWMNQQLSIYFQGSCKNPNLSCHQQCWGSWAEKSALDKTAVPCSHLSLSWATAISHYTPIELSWSWPHAGSTGGVFSSLTNLIVPHFLPINGTRCGVAPPNVPISIICLH